MKKLFKISWLPIVVLLFSSCDLLSPGESSNPNISEDRFLESSNAMATWVNGVEKTLATTVSDFCQQTEIMTDNYHNAYSRGSQDFDKPLLFSSDEHIRQLQREVGAVREAVDYAFNTVIKYDTLLTQSQRFSLLTSKAYAFLLAGENFRALPMTSGGDAKPWEDHLHETVNVLDEALPLASDGAAVAYAQTLRARAYYRLGDAENAVSAAQAALMADNDFCRTVLFDGVHNVPNLVQEPIATNYYQPLPRLDFLDPKYPGNDATAQRPVCIAKAEEDYLILAEAYIAGGKIEDAKTSLSNLLGLVATRKVEGGLDESIDDHMNYLKLYKGDDASAFSVQASPTDAPMAGLLLNRTTGNKISVPIVSGTSATIAEITACKDADSLLELVYRMRQEIFMAEGRRLADLGIRLPLSDVEASHLGDNTYTTAEIPAFIPLNGDMDAFTTDRENKLITIKYNMNRVLVENKKLESVVPFE